MSFQERLKEWREKVNYVFGFFYEPKGLVKYWLMMIPFVVVAYFYGDAAIKRHAINPEDRFVPYASQMFEAAKDYVFEEDVRTGEVEFVTDTLISLRRLVIGVTIFSVIALFCGVWFGTFAVFRTIGLPITTVLSIIPPLAITPIIFIALGVEETGKVMLIILGNQFLMIREIFRVTSEIPTEHYIKAMTLGFGRLAILRKIILPQVMPRFWETVKMSLASAWLYLIAAEYTAAEHGLACRILMLKRNQRMDLIIPIVLWIALLAIAFILLIEWWIRFRYPWYLATKKKG